jgi:hypothetical protein
VSHLQLHSSVQLFCQLTMTAEYKSQANWNARREICPIYKMSNINLTWTCIWLGTVIYSGKPEIWCILLPVFTRIIYIFIARNIFLTFYRKIPIDSFWKPKLAFWELLTILTKEICVYKNIIWLMFLRLHLLMTEVGEEQIRKIVCWTEREILQYKYECITRNYFPKLKVICIMYMYKI